MAGDGRRVAEPTHEAKRHAVHVPAGRGLQYTHNIASKGEEKKTVFKEQQSITAAGACL